MHYFNHNCTSHKNEAFYVLIIVFLAIILGFPNTAYIPFFDAITYLNKGVTFNTSSIAPIYAVWYKFLNLLGFAGVNLYHLNYVLLLSVCSLSVYYFSKFVGYSISKAFLIALVFTILSCYYKVMRVSHLALLFSILGIYFYKIAPHNFKLIALYLTSVFLLYIRAEYIAVTIILLFFIRDLRKIILLVGLTILLFSTFNNPLSGGRLSQALLQHYAFHYSLWYHANGNPWDTEVYTNIPFSLILYIRFCFENLIVVLPVIAWLLRKKIEVEYYVFMLPAIAISILIFPRPHYLIPVIPFVLLAGRNEYLFDFKFILRKLHPSKIQKQKELYV